MAFKDLLVGKKKQDEDSTDKSSKEERTLGIFPLDILKNLRNDLKNYVGLLPKLEEKKDVFEKEIDEMQAELVKTDEMLTKMATRKKQLEEDIKAKEIELKAIEDINGILAVIS